MEIPYNSTNRPDTGLYNAKVGIWLFLASEVMLFGALFSSYILLRIGSDPGMWPIQILDIPIGTVNTIVLIASSLTVLQAWASLKMNNLGRFKFYMTITVLCALAFMCIKSYEYQSKFKHYQVWMKDGSTLTGHIEYGDETAWFWKTSTLDEKEIQTLIFHPDEKQLTGEGAVSYLDSLEDEAEVSFYENFGDDEAAHEEEDGEDHGETEEGHDDDAESDDHGEEGHDDGDHGDDGHGHGEGHHSIEIPREDIARLSAFVPAHSTYFAIYFTMTGLHALHVIGGALVLLYFLTLGIGMWKTDTDRFVNRIEVGGLFWHFVDLVWIFLFPVMYLL